MPPPRELYHVVGAHADGVDWACDYCLGRLPEPDEDTRARLLKELRDLEATYETGPILLHGAGRHDGEEAFSLDCDVCIGLRPEPSAAERLFMERQLREKEAERDQHFEDKRGPRPRTGRSDA